jgi:K+:H+ antiporter
MLPLLRRGLYGAALWLVTTAPAHAAEVLKGPSEAVFVVQVVLLLVVGRMLGEALLRIGQPAVMGQLIAGILLGPSFFGALWPHAQHLIFPPSAEQKAMLEAMSQLGVLMLLLLAGMETDLDLVKKTGRAAFTVSISGIVVPFACGFALGEFLPAALLPNPDLRLVTALFLGTAMSIASVKIVATVIREMDFLRRTVGQVILASAIIDDTIGWIVTAIIFSLALQGTIDAMSVGKSVLGTIAFLIVSLTIGRRVVFALIRWTNDNFVSEFAVITMILVIMGVMALVTYGIGVHTVLGAFVAGILVGESPILTKHIEEELRGLITALFMPIFFGTAGLSADLTVLGNHYLLFLTIAFVAIASIGKFGGAFLGGRLGGLTTKESLALGCGMNARGSTEVIIATIGLSMGALNRDLFTIIVTMAVVTTMAMPPMLRWALARLPITGAERQRLEREKLEEKGFVPHLERLLLAVDDSANGKFTSRLAGMIAGSRGMPTTVIQLHAKTQAKAKPQAEGGETSGEKTEAAVKAAAETTGAQAPDEKEKKPLDVTVKVQEKPTEQAIAEEAEKGYGILVVGLGKMVIHKRDFHPDVNRVAVGFQGPLALVDARDGHLENPLESKLSILVPVSGTATSRNAAEVAFTIARASEAPVTVLYVAGRPARSGAREHEDAILKDIVELAGGYDITPHTAVRGNTAPEEAILRQANADNHNLIVMGASRRPGEKLFFGDIAAAVLEKSKVSLLLVSS